MLYADHGPSSRAALSFSIEGLATREELLFKSYVRLLDHRTQQNWFYCPQHANLRVVADGMAQPPSALPGDTARSVLTLGVSVQPRDSFLCLPLRADLLEVELNRQGALILSTRTVPVVSHLLGKGEELLRLLRWPPASLLANRDHIRLATLMTGQPLSLRALQQRSGLTPQVCAGFVEELRRSGLLGGLLAERPVASIPAKPAGGLSAVQPGLLARIRSRLGLQTIGGK